MRPLVVDNFDSFTFNLVHMLEAISDSEVEVLRPEEVGTDRFDAAPYVLFSPGPGLPREHRALMPLIRRALDTGKKTLGVCLGHQALALATGGELLNCKTVHHGVSHPVTVNPRAALFRGLNSTLHVGRYHSWMVRSTGTDDWIIDARDSEGGIMAMSHARLPVFGVQFHPESVLTPDGATILRNFLEA